MQFDSKAAAKEIDTVLAEVNGMRKYGNWAFESGPENALRACLLLSSVVERLAPPTSVFGRFGESLIESIEDDPAKAADRLYQLVSALRADYNGGRLANVTELVHGELFSDFLDMSAHLLEHGYKDAAAVICGAVLETHLRKLCSKSGIALSLGDSRPKKAEALNGELAAAGVYGVGDQKNVTAWLHLRNDAAHGHYDRYSADQVKLVHAGVNQFVSRFPA